MRFEQKLTPQEMVMEFHEIFKPEHIGLFQGTDVNFKGSEDLDLKLKLVSEEYVELVDAFDDNDFIEVVDALGDMIYVIYGMAIYLGIDLDKVITEIHRSNLSKLDSEGNPIYRSDGKVLKSENFEEPDIEGALEPL